MGDGRYPYLGSKPVSGDRCPTTQGYGELAEHIFPADMDMDGRGIRGWEEERRKEETHMRRSHRRTAGRDFTNQTMADSGAET